MSRRVVVGLVLIDAPFLLAVAVLGFWFGFGRVYWTVTDYRMAHPWTFVPSVVLAVLMLRRWRRSR